MPFGLGIQTRRVVPGAQQQSRPTASQRGGGPGKAGRGFRVPSELPERGPGISGGPPFLRQILEETILPDIRQRQTRGDVLYGDLMAQFGMAPGSSVMPAVREATEAYAEELFGPEGPVSEQITEALRGSVQSGFGPQGGGFVAARNAIGRRASETLARFLGQQALTGVGLETARLGTMAQFAGSQDELLAALIGSIFTGAAGAENLALQQWAIRRQT